jgi:hypothetical protein
VNLIIKIIRLTLTNSSLKKTYINNEKTTLNCSEDKELKAVNPVNGISKSNFGIKK